MIVIFSSQLLREYYLICRFHAPFSTIIQIIVLWGYQYKISVIKSSVFITQLIADYKPFELAKNKYVISRAIMPIKRIVFG